MNSEIGNYELRRKNFRDQRRLASYFLTLDFVLIFLSPNRVAYATELKIGAFGAEICCFSNEITGWSNFEALLGHPTQKKPNIALVRYPDVVGMFWPAASAKFPV